MIVSTCTVSARRFPGSLCNRRQRIAPRSVQRQVDGLKGGFRDKGIGPTECSETRGLAQRSVQRQVDWPNGVFRDKGIGRGSQHLPAPLEWPPRGLDLSTL
jgi:hypothetical protein